MLARAALMLVALLAAEGEPPPTSPLDLGVTEETGTSLSQIDVTLTGPADALARVGPDSFHLWVGGRKVDRVLADGVCSTAAPSQETATAPEESPDPAAPAPRPTTWLLYFDQPHLTQSGRARAIHLARDALPQILGKGDRATIVSNGRSLVTVQTMTQDLDTLLAALGRLEKDATQFESFATREQGRVDTLLGTGEPGEDPRPESIEEMLTLIRKYAEEERWRAHRDLSRLTMTLGRFADIEPHRAVLYFADTTRRNAGDHYLSMMSTNTMAMKGVAGSTGRLSLEQQADLTMGAELAFDRVVKQAGAMGIRFYTVEPQPLQDSATRVRDAQGTLQVLAAETGGKAFVNGVTPKRLVTGIREDFGCMWLLSFDPEGLPRDQALVVKVEVDVPKVKVRVRGQTVIQSASGRLTNRLLGHFAVESEDRSSPLRAAFVPLAWKDGKFSALLQVVAPPSSIPMATWDLGASVVASDKVAAETSARTRVGGSGVAVALETVVELKPGPFELVAVAREVTTDRVVSSRTEGRWPHPDDALAEVVQPVVLQPGPGAFTRDGEIRKSGSLVHGPQDALDPTRPTALIALVCRSKMVKSALDVSRVLEGASPVNFPPLALDLGSERCGQVRDLIPAKTLGPGRYRYQIVVKEKGTEIGRGETSFVVPE